jgi:hypothetical protein
LGLGQHLVRELGFGSQRDTLGRWMAHHVAELIDKANLGSNSTERAKARKIATETILKIWAHRELLPGDVYPLAPYKDLLKVLNVLQPDDNPFSYARQRLEIKRDQLAADLFDSLSRLIIALLLMKVLAGRRSADTAATKALNKTERDVLTAIHRWEDIFIPARKTLGQARKKGKDHSPKVNLEKVALQLIDQTMTSLGDLRNALEGKKESEIF